MTLLGIKNVVWLSLSKINSFTDNFTTDNWIDVVNNGLISVNTTAQHLQWDGTRVTNQGTVRDLQNAIGKNADNTKWVLRFKFVIDTITQGGGTSGEIIGFIISDKDESFTGAVAQDYIGFVSFVSSTQKVHNSNAGNGNDILSGRQAFAHTVAVETIYVEIIRESATVFTVELFSDNTYSTSLEKETDGASSSITNLRYVKVTGYDNSNPTVGNVYDGNIDDLEFYDGVSVAP